MAAALEANLTMAVAKVVRGPRLVRSSAMPAVPSEAVASQALPFSAMPSQAVPTTTAVPSSAVSSQAVPACFESLSAPRKTA